MSVENRDEHPPRGFIGNPAGVDTCAAFKAYLNLQGLPPNAKAFEMNDKGYPKVHQGEYVCHVLLGADGELCKRICRNKAKLTTHLESLEHGFNGDSRWSDDWPKHQTRAAHRAIGFYTELMKDMDYEGKERDIRNQERTNQTGQQTPRVEGPPPSAPSEERWRSSSIKREIDDTPNREVIKIESSPEPEETAVKVESPANVALTTQSSPAAGLGAKRKRGADEGEHDSGEEDLEAELKEIDAEEKLQGLKLRRLQVERKLAARKKR